MSKVLEKVKTAELKKELRRREKKEYDEKCGEIVRKEEKTLDRLNKTFQSFITERKIELPFGEFMITCHIAWEDGEQFSIMYVGKVRYADKRKRDAITRYVEDAISHRFEEDPWEVLDISKEAREVMKPLNAEIKAFCRECDRLGKEYKIDNFFEEFISS
jgi:hypothetical protein